MALALTHGVIGVPIMFDNGTFQELSGPTSQKRIRGEFGYLSQGFAIRRYHIFDIIDAAPL